MCFGSESEATGTDVLCKKNNMSENTSSIHIHSVSTFIKMLHYIHQLVVQLLLTVQNN